VRPYLIRKADSGKLHRLTAGPREGWVAAEKNQVPYNCNESRK